MPNKAVQALINDPNIEVLGAMPSLPKGALMGLLRLGRGIRTAPIPKGPLHPLASAEQKVQEYLKDTMPKVPEAWEGLRKIGELFRGKLQ